MTGTTEAHEGFPHPVVQRTNACSVDMDGMVAPLNDECSADGCQLQTAQTRMSILVPQKVVNPVAATLKRTDAPTFPGAKPEATQLLLNLRRPATRHGCRKHPECPGPRRGH